MLFVKHKLSSKETTVLVYFMHNKILKKQVQWMYFSISNRFTICVGFTLIFYKWFTSRCVGGVTVSMVAFQAVDPGSTPGRRTEMFLFILFSIYWDKNIFCLDLKIIFLVCAILMKEI